MPQLLADLAYGAAPRQTLDLFLPDGPAPRLFVFIHGGGWRGGDKGFYRPLGELLSHFGYAVALPNHRLAPEHPHPAALEDVARAIAWLHRYAPESGIRPEGMVLAGHSSGAHLAALLATRAGLLPPRAVVGAIGISGVYDLCAYADAPADPFGNDAIGYLAPVFGPDLGAWKEASPIHHVSPAAPPFLLAHAQFDYPGAADQAAAMAAALARVGANCQVVSVPGRDHVTILSGVRSMFDPLAIALALFLA